MRLISIFVVLFFVKPLFAEDSIVFKKELVANIHWFPYALTLFFLLVFLLILARKSKKIINLNPGCKIVERIAVHHKTQIFVIDYQGQKFLMADNQSALAFHPLQEVKR